MRIAPETLDDRLVAQFKVELVGHSRCSEQLDRQAVDQPRLARASLCPDPGAQQLHRAPLDLAIDAPGLRTTRRLRRPP